ncbi:MAG: aspartate aminotransferase family protein [Alphaproteobacteria bacterium]|nr:aspartate aminotransferase family protein [Alphaproteobacteria bacterium]
MTTANSTAARDQAHVLHPMTNLKKHQEDGPTVIVRGEGIRIFDESGRDYIEGMAGLWCTSLGFANKRLAEAAYRQMLELPYYHTFRNMTHPASADLAEKLMSIVPKGLTRVFFANSGSEANDSIVKMVWYYNNALGRPTKKKFISRQRAYHGSTLVAASLCGLPHMHKAFDLPIAGILHTDCPHHYRYALPGESEEAFATRLADNLEALIVAEGPETVAAFIAEPVMGGGGVIVPPRTYFEKVQKVLKKYDVLMVADEVICGFMRTGNMFGSDTYAIKPDIMTIAKALSSAYMPIAGVLVTDRIFQAITRQSGELGTFAHGFTYSAHPVPCAVALETLKIYEETDLLGHVRRVGPHFQAKARRFSDHPLVGEVRGVGLMAAIELVSDKQTKAPFDVNQGVGVHCQNAAEAHGLLTRSINDALAFSPPLIITEAEIDDMFARFGKALDETLVWAKSQGLAKVA